MAAAFEVADQIFRNAELFSANRHLLNNCSPIVELGKETRHWFSVLSEDTEDYAKSIKVKIWYLRATVEFTLLPFDSADLRLEEQLETVCREARYVPLLVDRIEQLRAVVQHVIKIAKNPKREKVFELLTEARQAARRTAVVSVLARGVTPGWTPGVIDDLRNVYASCELISSSRSLTSSIYDQIIFPAGGRLSSLLSDLYHGFRTRRLDLVVYSHEAVRTPEIRPLPKANLSAAHSVSRSDTAVHENTEAQDQHADDWIREQFWEELRQSTRTGHDGGEHQFLIKARLVLLANGTRIFLRDDLDVIEISELIDGRISVDELKRQFPKRRVSELRAGDLVALRTSGSGDHLIDVADSLMVRSGKSNLRTEALDWKAVLRRALTIHGPLKISNLIEQKGHSYNSPNYVWMWTTDLVIKPQTESLFYELVAILYDLGFKLDSDDPVIAAETRWRKMQELIRYHRIAGFTIRRALLKRLREIIEEGAPITDFYRLTLPGVSAGELSVFRIADVDPNTAEVPYNQLGIIFGR